jgi:hypothetical protein
MGLLESHKPKIQALCKDHKVSLLYSFGSVNSKRFNPQSDVDLLVEFAISDPLEYAENYFNLKFELEKVLERSIDLLESKAIKNPFLKESIEKSKVLLYAQ